MTSKLIKVSFDGKPHDNGLASQLSWSNPDLIQALRIAFGCAPNERIVGLTLSETSIVAYFESRLP